MIESKVVDSIPTLNENDCQIWWARISDLQSWHYNLLNDIEREKANSYHHSADRARFIIGCVISRLVLGKILSMSPVKYQLIECAQYVKCSMEDHNYQKVCRNYPFRIQVSGLSLLYKICTCWHRCRTNESKCRCYENGRRCINRH